MKDKLRLTKVYLQRVQIENIEILKWEKIYNQIYENGLKNWRFFTKI